MKTVDDVRLNFKKVSDRQGNDVLTVALMDFKF